MRALWPLLLLTACSDPPAKAPAPPPAPPAPPVAAAAPAPEVPGDADAGTNDDPRAWVTSSADGRSTLRQKSVGGECYAECRLGDGTQLWEGVGACMAARHERRFLANDCERVVVIIPAPDRGKSWASTEVMRVYARNKLEYAVQGLSVIPEKFMVTSTSWLKGCYGVPGEAPRYAADGLSVEYETIQGKAGSVPLVAPPKPAAPAPAVRHPAHRAH